MCGENAQYQHENSKTCFKKNLAGEIMWRNETDFVLEWMKCYNGQSIVKLKLYLN